MRRSQGRDHLAALDDFAAQGLIADVLGLIKTGKEASVYCCRAGPAVDADLIAAKVYRERQYRFKNDAVYQEARSRELGLRGRPLRAFEQKSRFGREVQDATWQGREFETLRLLHDAGADVPRAYGAADGVILMEYLGDVEQPATQLNRVHLQRDEAEPLFRRLMANVELFLACDRVHGDLSPHNVLYDRGEVRVIDFPQAIDPRFNRHARDILQRDVANLCRYFAAYGVGADAEDIADELWRRFEYGEL